MEPEKCESVDWFELNDLPSQTIPFVKQAILYVKEKVIYSEFGYSS